MTTNERYRAILANHLPEQAVGYVYDFLDRHGVHFHITRGRRTKYGDYRRPHAGHPYHEMSVNGDLAPGFFLWVFLHEAAHLRTHLHSAGAAAHGHEWQAEYARLMVEAAGFFPPGVREDIGLLASRIPLNRALMGRVERTLRDGDDPSAVRLDQLPAGSLFRLEAKPELLFESVERRRTRWLCTDRATGRQYTVSGQARVVPERGRGA